MFEKYKEPYEYLKTEAEGVSQAVKQNRPSFGQRVKSVPGFFRDGLHHMRNVEAVFPLMFIKLFLFILIVGITGIAAIWGSEFFHNYGAAHQGQAAPFWMFIVYLALLLIPFIALVTMLEGVFNGAMGAATYMHAEGHPATVEGALYIAMRNAPTIWKFNIIQFVVMILTSSGQKSGLATTFAKAAIRTAWTYGSIGMMPAILNGKGLTDAMKRSIDFLKTEPIKIISLVFARGFCGAVILLSAVGLIALGLKFEIYSLFIPAVVLIILMLFVYPIYVSVLYMLYLDFLKEQKYSLQVVTRDGGGSLIVWVLAFYTLCTVSIFVLGMIA